jgi:hypothetical protein
MRQNWHLGTALFLGVLANGLPLAASQNISVNTRGEPLERCDQLDVTYDSQPAARGEQNLLVPLADAPALTVSPPENGGVHVVGWDRAEYAITACKAAPTAAAVEGIDVSVSRGVVTANGPSSGPWVVYLIVKAPTRADLTLKTTNGPISVAGVSGSVHARTTNGPIGLKDSGGRIDVRAQNGPVSFAGRGGEVSLTAVNGPINVRLDGDRWQDGSLAARAENGPVHVRVAENYRSGVRVESSGHSPWACKGEACRAGRNDWDDRGRSVELGTGPTVVRISTVNGPVAISSPSDK